MKQVQDEEKSTSFDWFVTDAQAPCFRLNRMIDYYKKQIAKPGVSNDGDTPSTTHFLYLSYEDNGSVGK